MYKIVISVLLTTTLSAGGWLTGSKLVEYMGEYKKVDNGASKINYNYASNFTNYIFGVADVLEDTEYICIPSNVTGKQIFAIVIKYIDNHPAEWNKTASYLVEKPLLDTFPCKKKK